MLEITDKGDRNLRWKPVKMALIRFKQGAGVINRLVKQRVDLETRKLYEYGLTRFTGRQTFYRGLYPSTRITPFKNEH